MTLALFILETDNPSRRTWANIFSASDNSSVYKYGQTDELSSKFVLIDELSAKFVLVDELKWIIRLDELSTEMQKTNSSLDYASGLLVIGHKICPHKRSTSLSK